MTLKDWVVGSHEGIDARAKNYIAMELNRYCHITNWKGEDLSLQKFKGALRATERTEMSIAMKRNKSHTHEMKWKAILRLLN